ncbi:uncharacterized protein V6R79_018285 [Siganus canaliculatus]
MTVDNRKTSFSESLLLDDSEKGVIITEITDDTIAAKSGLKAGDEIVAATIHLDHLSKSEVLNILKVLEPYDNNMKVLTKKELNTDVSLGSLGLGLTDPAEMLSLKKDLSLNTSAGAPAVSLDGQTGILNGVQGLGGEITGPTFDGDPSGLNLNLASANAGVEGTVPSIGVTGPDINGGLNSAIKIPDVSVSTPELSTNGIDVKKPELKTSNLKYKTPKFTMPHFNLPQFKTPKAEMNVEPPSVSGNMDTDVNLSLPDSPEVGLSVPKVDLNGPDVNLEGPNADIEAPSGKFRWPHLKWKGPKVKGPEANINADLSGPDADLSAPNIKGDLGTPNIDINLPKADIEGPDLDIETPNVDGPSGKINWPHLKWKKPKLHSPEADLNLDASLNTADVSVPDVNAEINATDMDLNLPRTVDLEAPNIEAEAPSGKINWPHLKWKKAKIPKADLDIDLDQNKLNLPTVDIDVPDAELHVPDADLEGPNLDIQTPEVDIDDPSGKFHWPHLKWKKPKLHGPKADVDLNADISTPDLSIPQNDCELSTPDVDLNLPKADLNITAPDADVEAPSAKIRFPTLKKPKLWLSGPKVKSPDVDLDVNPPDLSLASPDVDLNLPKADVDVKAPNVEIENPSGKFKWPTLKKPKWAISGAKLDGPEVDLDADVSGPELNLSAPNIDGEINVPDANLALEKPELDITAPDVEGPAGKFKWFNFKKPKSGTLKTDINTDLKVPDVDLKAPDVDLHVPDFDISVPKTDCEINAPDPNICLPSADIKGPDIAFNSDLKTPDLSLSAPNVEAGFDAPDLDIDLPKADLKGPDADLQAPEVEGLSGKFKWFNFKMPKFGTLKGPKADMDADVKTPDVDLKVSDVDVSVPDLNLSAPKTEVEIDAPDFNISTPNAEINSPDVAFDGDLKPPNLSLSAPDVESSLDAPSLEINLPKADVKSPDVDLQSPDIDASAGKFKLPKIKFPKFNLSGPSVKEPDLNVDASLKGTDLELPAPTIEGDLNLKADIDPPSSQSDLTLPVCSLPTLEIKGPDVDAALPKTDIEGAGLDLPKADFLIPDPSLKAPDLNCSSPVLDGTISTPHIDANLAKGELEVPDVKLKAPNVDVNMPTADVKGPDAQLKAPDLNLDTNHDFKLPTFKLPTLGLQSPKVEIPAVDSSVEPDLKLPDVAIPVPQADLPSTTLEGDIKGPKLDMKNVDVEKSKLPHFKLPKLNFSGSTVKVPEVDTSADLEVIPDVNVKSPDIEAEVSAPHVSATVPEVKMSPDSAEVSVTAEAEAEVKGSPKSKLRWPFKWGLRSNSTTDVEVNGVDSDTEVPDTEVGIPEFKFHRLPRNNLDGIGGIGDTISIPKVDTEAKDYVISKGIRLPIVNATSKSGEKVDIMERLKMAMEKVPTTNLSPTASSDGTLKLAAPGLDTGCSLEAGDASLTKGGTFKVEKPESVLGLATPEMLTSDENDKLSLSLSNMLCLNTKESDTD